MVKEKLKICYIGDAQSIHLQRWARWFAERGYEVHLITDRPHEIKGVKLHTVKLGRNAYHQARYITRPLCF